MFIDEADITLQGGHGGQGRVSFGRKMGSGPDGGNGGRGGDVYFQAVNDITLLTQFTTQTSFEAEFGHPGGRNRKSGKDGADLEILIPIGTTVIDKETESTLFEMTSVGQPVLVCKGGKGGRGNYEFRSPRRTTPEFAQPGLPGEKKSFSLILKLIADFGLIGLPNAGKSSLLNELTNAKSKVAQYPFTTLTPNLGVFKGRVIADIPGLIEGASEGRGLGVSFLKHIEKVGVLLHCLSSETADPLSDYRTVRKELGNYNKELLKKPEIILVTKSDLTGSETIGKILTKLKNKTQQVLSVSIHDWDSIEKLKQTISQKIGPFPGGH
jgi:GTP-binding protein